MSSLRSKPFPLTMFRPHATAIAGLIAILTANGCGALKRVHECEAVIETVNTGLEEIGVQAPDAGSNSVAYEQIANAYDDLVGRIEQLQVEDAGLRQALDGYEELAARAARHSRSFAAELATRAKSRSARKKREARLKSIRSLAKADLSREAAVVRKLNALCHPH